MNQRVLRIVGVVGLSLAVAVSVFAWRWPLADFVPDGDFGVSEQKVINDGVDISSKTEAVRAVQDGVVIFADADHPGTRRLPVAMGAMMAISHDDDIVSVYEGLSPESVQPWSTISGDQASVREGATIARVPEGKAMRILIADNKLDAWINPFLTLPVLPDDRSPVISDIAISYPLQSELITLKDRMQLLSREFSLQASIRDLMGIRGQSGAMATFPYSITVFWNGEIVFLQENTMLRRSESSGRNLDYLRVTPKAIAASRRSLSGDISISLKAVDGVNRLEIRAVDFAGNRTASAFRLIMEAAPSIEKPTQ